MAQRCADRTGSSTCPATPLGGEKGRGGHFGATCDISVKGYGVLVWFSCQGEPNRGRMVSGLRLQATERETGSENLRRT